MTSQPNACQSNRQKSHFHLSSSALQPGTQQLFLELICISLVSQAEAAKARAPRIKKLPPPLLAWPVRGGWDTGGSLFSELRLWSALSIGHQRATVVHTSGYSCGEGGVGGRVPQLPGRPGEDDRDSRTLRAFKNL